MSKFTGRSGAKLGGIIGNLRELKNEEEILAKFAEMMGTQVVGFIPYSEKIKECSGKGVTLYQLAPQTKECDAFRALSKNIWNNRKYSVPNAINFEDLYKWWRGIVKK